MPTTLTRVLDIASVREGPLRIPGDFPQMAIGVLEIAGIAAPERLLGRLDDDRPGLPGLFHDLIDLGFRRHIVAQAERRCTRRSRGQARILGKARARIERELETALQVEEGHGAVLEFRAEDALRREA